MITVSTYEDLDDFKDSLVCERINVLGQLLESSMSAAIIKSVALCHLKQKNYDKATEYFKRAIEQDGNDPDNYYYAAVCKLRGNPAFTIKRSDIDEIEQYITNAITIKPKGVYYYLRAYIRYDYFFLHNIIVSPGYKWCLGEAYKTGFRSSKALDPFWNMLGVMRPYEL